MCIANKKKIIIAAVASRAYVKAAVAAGFDVVAIDAFADQDLQRLATHCYQIQLHDSQLDSQQLLAVLDGLDLKQFAGFCYGAGFEKQTEVLSAIGQRIRVLCNTAQTVERCKAPHYFFNQCNQLKIPHPEFRDRLPNNPIGWLQKDIGGSGGGHIKRNIGSSRELKGTYFQKLKPGKSISCLFLANGHEVQVIGFSEQWSEADSESPFRYGGSVGYANLSEVAKERFTSYVKRLSCAVGLVGLNSCDAVCDGDDVIVLEVNPRLSATVDLYLSQQTDLLSQHIAACCTGTLSPNEVLGSLNVAHHVVYAEQDIDIASGFSWPGWAKDLPEDGMHFKTGMPVCTVWAEASTVEEAKSLVQQRAQTMKKQFLK